ncbi:MAG: uroporphyrinogen-III C-methyltransferase [Pseudomonadota bacterium]
MNDDNKTEHDAQNDAEAASEDSVTDDSTALQAESAAEASGETSGSQDADFDEDAAPANAASDAVDKPKRSKAWLFLVLLIALAAAAFFGKDLLMSGDNEASIADTASNVAQAQQTEQSEAATAAGRTEPEPGSRTRDTASDTTRAEPARMATAPDLIPAASVADTDRLRADIEMLSARLDQLTSSVAQLDNAVGDQARQTQSLESDIEQRVNLLDSLPGRVRNTEEALVTLQGISAGSRSAWLLAESEYYMQIANAQLQLANNPELASKALQLADQRVRELADPAYTPVRRALSEELASLAGLKRTDIEGVTLTLGSLASLVSELPLDNTIERQGGAGKAGDTELTGMARVKATIRNAASSLVTWRKSDEAVKAVLSPEAEYFLRLNVQLQLQAARLSLLLGDNAGYQQSLNDSRQWIVEYFDGSDERVRNALEMIDAVGDVKRSKQRPNISGSLTMLRQQRELAAIGGSAAVDVEDDAAADTP